ncbi:hypothetical protein [Clostridium cellulovorans]|uniref:Lipoprotein n=1 Tax=Clostridium cellulovorans (strain ATCC 35296 / DSM 3052 / OCM 3 / 743B) TaxID=573061 RepID=D9SNK3_CLOC7|nr:hypothetical protein [Clostridium cellulovorans]ADL53995.1 hypothetical protein Clocel_4338 [Clostridium cellulovorans 743B]
MKKINTISVIILMLIMLLYSVSIIISCSKPDKLKGDIEYNELEKLEIIDEAEDSIITIIDKDKLKKINEYISNFEFDIPPNTYTKTWTYILILYRHNGSELVITFRGDNLCVINKRLYSISNYQDGFIKSFYD